MSSVPTDFDDARRCALLDSLNLLDPSHDPVFDCITRLTSRLLKLPIVVFSVSDSNRQICKSCFGIEYGQQSLQRSLFAPTVLQSALIVENALHDRRLQDHPLVTEEPHVRFCACVPIRTGSGLFVGTLCALDSTPRALPDDEFQILQDLAGLLAREIGAREQLIGRQVDLETEVTARTAQLQEANIRLTAMLAQQTRSDDMLMEREAELSSVIENANDAYISHDENGVVTGWNREAEQTFGWSRQEALGKLLAQLIIPEERVPYYQQDIAGFRTTGTSSTLIPRLELPAVRKNGSGIIVEARVSPLNVNGRRIFSCFMHDITARKQAEAQREYESRHDVLTGLLNRRAMTEILPLAQARTRRTRQALGLLFIDLDGFKAVNDTWGHDAGDLLLRTVADRIAATVRQSDTVFRLAGDEFTVILEGLHEGHQDAASISNKLIEKIGEPIRLECGTAYVGASIGIGIFHADREISADGLIREADQWMYHAKQAGRGQVFPRCDRDAGSEPVK